MEERARLVAGLDAAERGEAGLVLLGGEAGIGKTRLAAELAGAAAERGDLVVRGHCVEATSTSMPFAPFIEIVRTLVLGDRPQGAAGTGTSVLAHLVPELEPHPAVQRPRADAADRFRLFHAVHELLAQDCQ